MKMNTGGEVPGKGDKDTVPAMLTPGEFVMSKGAVEQYGVDTLEGMNAAAGGTNIPTLQKGESGGGGTSGTGLLPRYAGGGSAKNIDKSHYGTPGYRIGQIMPDQYVYSKDSYYSKMVTKGDEVIENESRFTSIGGAIAKEDLLEHQKQLVGELRKQEGYEKVNIIDVLQRVEGQGRLVDMPDEVLYPILNASDAYKATGDKIDAAHKIDLESRGHGDGSKGWSMMYNGGGLVPGYAGGGLINQLPQVRAAKWLGKKAKGVFSSIKDRLSPNQAGKAIPGAPVKPSTTIAYAKEAAAKAGGTVSSGAGGPKVPSFNAGAKVDTRKVKVLGISR